MNNWKQAFELAKYEVRKSGSAFLLIFFLAIAIGLFIALTATQTIYNVKENYFFDFILILLFVVPSIGIPKSFRLTNVKSDLWVAPSVLKLLGLPIEKDVISKSRILVHFTYISFFNLLILPTLYFVIPGLSTTVSVWEYIVISLALYAFSLAIAMIPPAADSGDIVSKKKILIYTVSLIFTITLAYLVFTYFSEYSLLHWIIYWAKNGPILTSIGALILLAAGPHFAHQYNLKQMKRTDYL